MLFHFFMSNRIMKVERKRGENRTIGHRYLASSSNMLPIPSKSVVVGLRQIGQVENISEKGLDFVNSNSSSGS